MANEIPAPCPMLYLKDNLCSRTPLASIFCLQTGNAYSQGVSYTLLSWALPCPHPVPSVPTRGEALLHLQATMTLPSTLRPLSGGNCYCQLLRVQGKRDPHSHHYPGNPPPLAPCMGGRVGRLVIGLANDPGPKD
uniref:Uncharacterized protein n=1 Tax=Myotis myotis TaxID=51298 RepID=A0A7J7VIA0_MYOMY|nr:hypothetical protein mMyoMyo1_008228 [Myotis myotis]